MGQHLVAGLELVSCFVGVAVAVKVTPVTAADAPACKYFPPSHTSVINFDPDFKVTPGTIPRCDPASLAGKDVTGARAACPGSIVGQGTSEIHTLTETNPLFGTVTAFNGLPSGGNPMVLLHMDIDGSTTSPILTALVRGNVLTVKGQSRQARCSRTSRSRSTGGSA